jgi:hypothetical protein
LRTRNMAYPPSRHMAFRIGITIGDVVERDGDLLGDGVNIAARLEGLAEVGGICVSRAVHEQVANKLSVQFADIGAQEVKNIPTPVHAYMVAMRREDGTYATPQVKKPPAKATGAPSWMWPVVVGVVSVVAICVAGFLYFTKLELTTTKDTASATKAAAPSPSASTAPGPASSPSPTPTQSAQTTLPPGPPPIQAGERMVATAVPFVSERVHAALANEFLPGADYKAFALNLNGYNGSAVGQASEDAAKNAALDQCRKRAEAAQSPRPCELYAVGNTVVYPHGKPPMPPAPWVRRDSITERPFAAKDMPMIREAGRTRLDNIYLSGRKSRSIALGPGGQFIFNIGNESAEESMRRSLESCGALAGVPCMIVALDDAFVVSVPALMKVTGFFRPVSNASVIADARDGLARQLAEAPSGWNAVAVGSSGRPGVGVKASSEQNAINDALGNCVKRDTDCHVIAIGPFTVGPNN